MSGMHILQVHNYYRLAGGEDRVLADEEKLLLRRGHLVWQYSLHNDAIADTPAYRVAAQTVWNGDAYRAIRRRIQQNGIEVVHVHNTFPLISPAVYFAARAERTPVVQTLHNYRLLCPSATLFRDGHTCEDCVGKRWKWPAVVHRCYRKSVGASAGSSVMLGIHNTLGTYASKVDAYITFNRFALEKFVEGGLPRDKLFIKPNFLADDPGIGSGYGGYALFAGRLTVEKGILTLLDAWAKLNVNLPLKIAGDGPLRTEVEARVTGMQTVEYLGHCERARLIELMRSAALLVFPSRWYEGSPLAVIEAMACGTPVLAFSQGSLKELIVPDQNGFLCEAEGAAELAACVEQAFSAPEHLNDLRYSTRRYYEAHFSAAANYEILVSIYNSALTKSNIVRS